jgi:hypothetical protein
MKDCFGGFEKGVCGFGAVQRMFLVNLGMPVRVGSVEGVLCERVTGVW